MLADDCLAIAFDRSTSRFTYGRATAHQIDHDHANDRYSAFHSDNHVLSVGGEALLAVKEWRESACASPAAPAVAAIPPGVAGVDDGGATVGRRR